MRRSLAPSLFLVVAAVGVFGPVAVCAVQAAAQTPAGTDSETLPVPRPDDPEAHFNLARALVAQHQPQAAIAEYRKALRLAPQSPQVMNDLARLLATWPDAAVRQPEEAIQLATRACELTGRQDPATLDTLAAAYAAAGRFPEAATTARQATARAEAMGETGAAAYISGRARFYDVGDGLKAAALAHVVPIDWSRFKRYDQMDPRPQELDDCAKIFLNTVRYNLPWSTIAIGKFEGKVPFAAGEGLTGLEAHNFIRPVCNAVFGIAVALKTGVYDEKAMAVSRQEAIRRVVQMIHGAAKAHQGQGWGYGWQSAFWTAYLAHGAWLLWEELDDETRTLVANSVETEANSLIAYTVPYWNGRGGDSKAEENAWYSTVLSLAVAMMPRHPNARLWKEKCSELMVSAYATQQDMENESLVDGKPAKNWLHGFNVNPDGSVINHNVLHPDYILCVHFNLRAFIVQPLANQVVPEAADFNASLVYRCLARRVWPSPPYMQPGGTIYRPGQPYLYYPQGSDWGQLECVTAYMVDVQAKVLGLDRGLSPGAQDWMHVRAAKILEMQQRHKDGRIWADGEFDTWPGREQTASGRLGNAFLALWLHAQNYPVRKGNWLEEKG